MISVSGLEQLQRQLEKAQLAFGGFGVRGKATRS
jgi:hypothetical protein